MPCMCWYDPSDADKLEFKRLCQALVDHLRKMQGRGDPQGYDLDDALKLIKHLYNPLLCKERK